jgi:hypothetical protein
VRDSVAFLAKETGRDEAELRVKLLSGTSYDLDQFVLAQLSPDDPEGALAICRWLLMQQSSCQFTRPEELASRLNEVLGTWPLPWIRVMAALAAILPFTSLPTLLLVAQPASAGCDDTISAAVQSLTGIIKRVPALSAAIAMTGKALEEYQASAPQSQMLTLVREGVVQVPSLGEQETEQLLHRMGVQPNELAGPIRRLAVDGVSRGLAESFAKAVLLHREEATEESVALARSTAEQFLYERLESLPETAGLFELNGSPDFRFGRSDAETDLLSKRLRLVIELDGCYFHLNNREAYRRDRRKDFELQRRGFFVLRFLSEEVVSHLEEILDRILAAVDHCQARSINCEPPDRPGV